MESKHKTAVDPQKVEDKVKAMYKDVAQNPKGEYHFEMGYDLAVKLGYAKAELAKIPQEAIDSFAGVGYHFGLAKIKKGEKVLDLGCGSGMDLFYTAKKVGDKGMVEGVDMTDEQLEKSIHLAEKNKIHNVTFMKSYIEELPFEASEFDVVISNGVINLSSQKLAVFHEAARVLKKGGRLAISDIVTEVQMPNQITCNSTLWAACIGGAMQEDQYKRLIQNADLKLIEFKKNPKYKFISESAINASKTYGVKSISLLAIKE
ncbi:methyltransferase domain-containing protein [Sediminitomix flava]|uniref:Arsenite methyltransferase n=1 Tax=Sediminitomix flava TaxID=379075 RepID=A0A315ZCC3_SEDFL|nr:methyltransferase domain-containing protein [Sediminitomix flava]PWJ42769.1 methyltransferase family protein [Sediminitomix flava]